MLPVFDNPKESPMLDRLTRRHFFGRSALGAGTAALAGLLAEPAAAEPSSLGDDAVLGDCHHPPRAKQMISLFMSGGPSQMDLWDHKPMLNKFNGTELPDSIRQGQ